MRNRSKPGYSKALLSCMLLLAAQCPVMAEAGFTYNPPGGDNPGKLSGDFPLDRIGKIKLPRGMATFSGDELLIKAVPNWLFDRNVVFKGPIIRAEAVPQNKSYVLGGLAIMLEGLWVANVAAESKESVDTVDGATVSGQITGRTADAVVLKKADGSAQNVPFNKIKTIHSPRAFLFNIYSDGVKINPADSSVTFTANSVLISPALANNSRRTYVPRFGLAGTEAGISKRALAMFVTLDIINMVAPAVVIPLVLNARNQQAAKTAIARTEFQNFVQSLQSSSPPPTQAPASSSPGGGG